MHTLVYLRIHTNRKLKYSLQLFTLGILYIVIGITLIHPFDYLTNNFILWAKWKLIFLDVYCWLARNKVLLTSWSLKSSYLYHIPFAYELVFMNIPLVPTTLWNIKSCFLWFGNVDFLLIFRVYRPKICIIDIRYSAISYMFGMCWI